MGAEGTGVARDVAIGMALVMEATKSVRPPLPEARAVDAPKLDDSDSRNSSREELRTALEASNCWGG